MINYSMRPLRRRTVLTTVTAALLAGASSAAMAQDVSGDLVIMQWQGGSDLEMWHEVEDLFMQEYPNVTVREFTPAGGQGDARSGMRTAFMGGETVDILINTWPAFTNELVDAGILRPIDAEWDEFGWSDKLGDSWKNLASYNGSVYGVTYTYGDRSAVWYKKSHLEKAGIEPPQTWDEFLASFAAMKAAGFDVPVTVPAKYWAHAEYFETLLARTAGVEFMSKLAVHEVPWTSPEVKAALMNFKDMLDADCCGDVATMLANDLDQAYSLIFGADQGNFFLMGMWTNAVLKRDYELEEGVDYSIFQFPSVGQGHDNTSMVDAKWLNVTTNGANPDAANAFLDFIISGEAADLMAGYGYASPSTEADNSLLGPVQQIATNAVASSEVQFVLGDLLPGDLVDEYRVQLQRFLQDPTEATIDSVLEAIEAKAAVSY